MSNGANNNVRSQEKCLQPVQPPLPTPPEKSRRKNKSRVVVKSCQPQCDISNCPSAESVINEYDTTDTATGMIETKFPRSRDDAISELSVASNNASDDPVPKSTAPKPPFLSSSSKRRAFEEYPPLFFTLHDFEDVMSSMRNKDDFVNVPSTNLDDFREESSITHIPDDVCFRVTTTNLPFEKCLDRWRDSFGDENFGQKFDNYRFEDSVNKNNQKTSDYISDNNDYSECRAGTKVRFVITSPFNSPKHDFNRKSSVSCDSWQNCKFIFANDEQANVQSTVSSVKLTEIQDESMDVKDCADISQNKSRALSASEKETFITTDDNAFMPSSVNKAEAILKTVPQVHCNNKSNNINCEKIGKDESNWTLRNEHENLESGKENRQTLVIEETAISEEYAVKQTYQSEKLDVTLKITENTCRFSSENSETACKSEQANTEEIIQERTPREEEIFFKTVTDNIKEKCTAKNETIFINELSYNSLNDHADDNVNQDTFYDTFYDRSKERTFFDDLTNKSARIEETRRLSIEEAEETNKSVDSENNRENVLLLGEIFEKNVPVKVRRNFFLETMLSNDTEDIPLNFKVISTQSIVSLSSINEALNITKEASDKIELDTDITRESELGFNKATEVDRKDQKVLKNSKKIKKVTRVPSADIMQSESKSVGDVKNDVLNELLCNFSNIKLKTVSSENKKSTTQIGDNENIICPVVIDNRICKEKENASSDSLTFEGSRDEVYSDSTSRIVDANNDIPVVERIVEKEDFMKMKIEERSQDSKNHNCDLAIDEKTTINNNIQMTMVVKSSCNIKTKTVEDSSSTKMKIKEKSSDISPEETYVEIKIEKTLTALKSADIKSESKKLQDIPKPILKKTKTECEQTNQFQKRISIGAPATMNKIFDSRELEKHNVTSEETHRSEEKTDKVNVNESAVDQKRNASQSILELDITTDSGDKCAIAKKITSVIPCNNNDNNRAVTPVDNINNDQSSRDIVTITPGKVRSFVKYYEIRSDATTNVESYSKINDREKVARRKSTKSYAAPIAVRNSYRPEVIKDSRETKGGIESVTSNDVTKMSNNIRLSSASRHPEDSTNKSFCKTAEAESKVTQEYKKNVHVLDEKTRAPLTKAGAKKSVQFLGGFTVIHSETFDGDESSGIAANTLKKKRVPPSPRDCQEFVHEIKSEKLLDAKMSSLQQRDAVAQVS